MWSWKSRALGGEELRGMNEIWKMTRTRCVDRPHTGTIVVVDVFFSLFFAEPQQWPTNENCSSSWWRGPMCSGGRAWSDAFDEPAECPPVAVLWEHLTVSQSTIAKGKIQRPLFLSISLLAVLYIVRLLAVLNYDTNCIPSTRAAFPSICTRALSSKPSNNYSFPSVWHGSCAVHLALWRQRG